jgi:hypothetical protein
MLFALGLFATTPSFADEGEAETCVRTKVWDGYSDGWGIRTMTTTTLAAGATRNYLVTFYPNKEYYLRTCGDGSVKDLDLVVYDLEGKIVKRDDTADAQPTLMMKTDKVSTYYVVVHAKQLNTGASQAGVSLAVTYR